MSIRLSDYAIDEEEWIQTLDEEPEWLPNPYQAQAEAQVRAGAWPGASLLGLRAPPYGEYGSEAQGISEPAPHDGPLWSMKQQGGDKLVVDGGVGSSSTASSASATERRESTAGASSTDKASTWSSPWRFLFEFRASERTAPSSGSKQHGGIVGDVDSTDEGDVDADLPETPGSTTEATEGDDSGTPGSTSQRSGSGVLLRKLSHPCVPRNTDLSQFAHKSEDLVDNSATGVTTLMIRNIPNLYTRSMLMEELDSLGFRLEYDFVYLPIDKSTQWNVGYAFVNFATHQAASRCVDVMTNYTFCRFEHGSGKVAQVSIAHIQGLERNLQYYENTAVKCARIQSHRPLVLTTKQQLGGELTSPGLSKQSRRRRRRLRPVERGEAAVHQPQESARNPGLQALASSSAACSSVGGATPVEP